MADCSKYSGEEAGFDISAQKTSLIQYFRCRSRGSHCRRRRAPASRSGEESARLARNWPEGDLRQVDVRSCCGGTSPGISWGTERVKERKRERGGGEEGGGGGEVFRRFSNALGGLSLPAWSRVLYRNSTGKLTHPHTGIFLFYYYFTIHKLRWVCFRSIHLTSSKLSWFLRVWVWVCVTSGAEMSPNLEPQVRRKPGRPSCSVFPSVTSPRRAPLEFRDVLWDMFKKHIRETYRRCLLVNLPPTPWSPLLLLLLTASSKSSCVVFVLSN